MIYDRGIFSKDEIIGVAGQLDDPQSATGIAAQPVRWMFRDDENGMSFIHYAKWLDEVETEFYKLIELVFNRYCAFRSVTVNEVYSARITLLVQSNNREPVIPEVAYPNECNKFVYFATPTDTPCIINGVATVPEAGDCMIMYPSDTLTLSRPHMDNFFTIFEVEFK